MTTRIKVAKPFLDENAADGGRRPAIVVTWLEGDREVRSERCAGVRVLGPSQLVQIGGRVYVETSAEVELVDPRPY